VLKIRGRGTIGSDRLFRDEGTILNGKYHKVLLIDDGVFNADCFVTGFRDGGVDMVEETLDELVLTEEKCLYTHG
jgi:hypothetical protein